MSDSLSLVSELERLVKELASPDAGDVAASLPMVAGRIAKSLGVKATEVAILGVSHRRRHLYFLAPEALKNIGYIPLSSTSALAARTARESRPEVNNNFGAARHASVFEGVKLGEDYGEAIQKIVSAPVLSRNRVVGVIQISRKGASPTESGPDFTAGDLGNVLALCKPLGQLLQHLAAE